MRVPAQKQRPRKAQLTSFPAPTGGLVSNRNLAMARQADAPPGAAVLNDFFPTATGVILRRGNQRKASIVVDDQVDTIFSYVTGSQSNLFAAVSTGIRDITTVADATLFAGPDVLMGQTGAHWNVVQFATAGGEFLIGVNGMDDAFEYDGAAFSSAAITFPVTHPTLDTSDLSYVWVYKQRIWFIEKNSLNVWYLPVDQIAGELTLLPLGGVFVRGGTLIWGQAWSLESGGSGGLSEQCVFTTTEGEVAAYQGESPDTAATWDKVGMYRVGRPMGDKAFMRAGGDIVIATTVGFVSLAAASQQDYAALGQGAVSYPIEDDWAQAVQSRGATDWRCEVWPDTQMAMVSPPSVANVPNVLFVANTNTGKWCKFSNWDVRSLGLFDGNMFFGTAAGTVQQAYTTGLDEDQPYFGQVVPLFEDFGAPANIKIAKEARAVVRAVATVDAQVTGQSNYTVALPPPPSIGLPEAGSEWGVGLWGDATWGSSRGDFVIGDWVPVGAYGHDISVGVQITSGSLVAVDAELIRVDVTFTVGEIGT